MLNDVLPPLEEAVLVDKDEWCFPQNSAPTHKMEKMQKWLRKHVPDFIKADDWLSSSPDLSIGL